jgi:hypothetical protein
MSGHFEGKANENSAQNIWSKYCRRRGTRGGSLRKNAKDIAICEATLRKRLKEVEHIKYFYL